MNIAAEFNKIKKSYKKLNEISTADDNYYAERYQFNVKLREFIQQQNFTDLNKNNLLLLCVLVSTYRPVEPWSFLLTLSIQLDKNKG